MSDKNFILEKVNDFELWDRFVNNSSQGTVFSNHFYLKSCDIKYHLWWIKEPVKEDFKIRAGISLPLSHDEKKIINDDLIIYSGVLFEDNKDAGKAKKFNDQFQILDFLSKELPKIYKKINLTFSTKVNDPRPFQWFGYNKKENKYIIDYKFTSYLDISELKKNNASDFKTNLFTNMGTDRRYQIRSAYKDGFTIKKNLSIDIFLDFYKKTLTKQKENISNKKISRIKKLINFLINNNKGIALYIFDKKENLIYVVIYIWDNKRAYYLFGAGNESENTPWKGAVANWEAFKYIARETKLTEVDLEGINSPQRGFFKMRFGGELVSYFNIKM